MCLVAHNITFPSLFDPFRLPYPTRSWGCPTWGTWASRPGPSGRRCPGSSCLTSASLDLAHEFECDFLTHFSNASGRSPATPPSSSTRSRARTLRGRLTRRSTRRSSRGRSKGFFFSKLFKSKLRQNTSWFFFLFFFQDQPDGGVRPGIGVKFFRKGLGLVTVRALEVRKV